MNKSDNENFFLIIKFYNHMVQGKTLIFVSASC